MEYRVLVSWDAYKLDKLPKGGTYSTISRFPDETDWPNGAMSVVIDFDEDCKVGDQQVAKLRFLAPDVERRLVSGDRFELHEGFRRSAVVTVL